MKAIVEIPLEREYDEVVAAIVEPLNARLRRLKAGHVLAHSETRLLSCRVKLKLSGKRSFRAVLEFLGETETPACTFVYWVDWLGRKRDVFMLGPDEAE